MSVKEMPVLHFAAEPAVHSLDLCFQFEWKSYTVLQLIRIGDCALTAVNHVNTQMSGLNLFAQCTFNFGCAPLMCTPGYLTYLPVNI